MNDKKENAFKEWLGDIPAAYVLLFFSIAVFLIQTLPRALSYGVFFDGLTYSSIARNLAEGKGSFWNLYYTDTLYPRFIEHPPLAMYIQSTFFTTFGDVFYLETVYGIVLGIITLFVIREIWKQLQLKDISLPSSFAPVLLFSLFPIVTWVFANNMIENTLTVFILGSVLFIMKALNGKDRGKQVVHFTLGSAFLFLAMLTKGPVALFPIILPLLWYFIYFDLPLNRAIVYWLLILIIIGALLSVFVFPFREAVHFFKDYYNNQIMRSLAGDREVADSKFVIFKRLFFESLVAVGISVITLLIFKVKLRLKKNKTLLFTLAIGLSGTLPFGLIPKQMGWYLIPAIPFFAMALASIFSSAFSALEEKLELSFKLKSGFFITGLILSIAAFGIMFSEYQKVRKEKDFFADLVVQPFPFIERSTITAYPKELAEKWSLLANLQRTFKVSLTADFGYRYLITTKEYLQDSLILKHYHRVHPLGNANYIVFEKNVPPSAPEIKEYKGSF